MAIRTSFTFVGVDRITGVANRVGNSVERVGDRFNRLGSQISRANQRLEGTRRVFGRVGSAMGGLKTKLGALAVAFGGFTAIKSVVTIGADFQDSLLDLSSITGATGKELKFLSDESLRLAKSSVVMQKDVAEAFKIVASAKSELLEDPKQLSEVTEQVLLLANASGLDLATSGKVVTEALNQFGAGADQASRFVNVLAAGAKIGASEVNETGVAVVKSGVAANLAGLSFEELNSAIQVLAQNGIKGEVAGTGLKTALLNLEKTGIKKIMPSVVGFDKSLENLAGANLTTAELTKLFGLEAISIGQILIQQRKRVGDWAGQITGTGVASEQAKVRLESFNKKIQAIQIMINDKLIAAFERLEPFIEKQAEDFANFIDSLDEKQIQSFVEGVVELAKALRSVAEAFVSVAGASGDIFTSAKNVVTGRGLKPAFEQAKNYASDFASMLTNGNFQNTADAALTTEEKTINSTDGLGKSSVTVDVNLKGQTDNVNSVKAKSSSKQLKIRTNMATDASGIPL